MDGNEFNGMTSKVYRTIFLCFVCFCMFSCGGDEDSSILPDTPAENNTMTISPDTLYLKADGKEQSSFRVKLNKPASFFAKAEKDWCKLDNADGSGSSAYTVLVSAEPNTQTASRLSRISFYSGENTEYAYVVQRAAEKNKDITITPDTLFLDGEIGSKGTVTVHLIDNSSCDLGENTYLDREIIKEENGKVLKIIYTVKNESRKDMVFKMGVLQHGMQKFYHVYQKAKKETAEEQYNITVTPDAHHVESKGGEVFSLIDLDRESAVTVTSDAVWCVPKNANFDTPSVQFKLYMQVYANSGKDARTAKVTVKAGTTTKTCTITQQGSADGKLSIGGTVADAVDLGLSVKWASHNLGASKEDEVGAYFAWGEVNPKQSYKKENYQYYNTTYATYTDLGENISGTQYDAASVHWGEEWRMPTRDELQEIYDKCSCKWTRVNNSNGVMITGPNGNSIFIPAGGTTTTGKPNYDNSRVYVWAGTVLTNDMANAWVLSITSTAVRDNITYNRSGGIPIRPVTKSDKGSNTGGGTSSAE